MTRLTRFWMVCRAPTHPGSQTRPVERYPSLADARAAARRLALTGGAAFVILETVEIVGIPDDDAPPLL
jgi:hypothetical protein